MTTIAESKITLRYAMFATDDFADDVLDIVFDRALHSSEKAAKLVYDDAKATLSRPSTNKRPWNPAFHPSKRDGAMLAGLFMEYMTDASADKNNPHMLVGNSNPEGFWQESGLWAVALFDADPYPYPWLAPAVDKNRKAAMGIIKDGIRGK